MDSIEYKTMAKYQDEHWWYRGRRQIIKSHIEKLTLPEQVKVLEIGCGTGGNLVILNNVGELFAVEMDEFARRHAHQLSRQTTIESGWLPDNLPFENTRFNLICLFDVLEHIENDLAALDAIKKRLAAQGRIIITVPAGKWMFGKHDKSMHHFRRYNSKQLACLFSKAGIELECITYFNSLLYPFAVLSRLFDSISGSEKSLGSALPQKHVNEILYRIFAFERLLLDHIHLPIGLSLLCIGRIK